LAWAGRVEVWAKQEAEEEIVVDANGPCGDDGGDSCHKSGECAALREGGEKQTKVVVMHLEHHPVFPVVRVQPATAKEEPVPCRAERILEPATKVGRQW
jgi:hypothetical protein